MSASFRSTVLKPPFAELQTCHRTIMHKRIVGRIRVGRIRVDRIRVDRIHVGRASIGAPQNSCFIYRLPEDMRRWALLVESKMVL